MSRRYPVGSSGPADLPIDDKSILALNRVPEAVQNVSGLRIRSERRGHGENLILPARVTDVSCSSEVVRIELNQAFLLRVVSDEVFGYISCSWHRVACAVPAGEVDELPAFKNEKPPSGLDKLIP
jgi:hypothetical protein